jgi:myo-inositol-1(or 4)-monophosphatase
VTPGGFGVLRPDDLDRIRRALDTAGPILARFASDGAHVDLKSGGDPVTEADLAVDAALREQLLRPGEGWLSEETADDASRLARVRCWIVDPLDGTKEFVMGIPEWGVSIGLVIDGEAMAGGFLNPLSGLHVVGAVGQGCWSSGRACTVRDGDGLAGMEVLASRSETSRGEWKQFADDAFTVKPTGSVAYKFAMVAAGETDATWTLVPKSEWDVAGGVALVRAAGGEVIVNDGSAPRFNREDVRLPGLIAAGPRRMQAIRGRLGLG